MTFHGSMPALDSSGVPGTLSPAVNDTLLRRTLRFQGVIVSDAMDMRAVLDQFGPLESVKRAVASGVDVLIQPPDAHVAIDAIVDGVREGRYPESRINDAARRILDLKRRLGLDRARYVDLDTLRSMVGDSTDVALARRIAERSITVVRDTQSLLPIASADSAHLLSITVAKRTDLAAGATFNTELRKTAPKLHAEYIGSDDPSPNYARLEAIADSSTVTIISSYVGQSWDVLTVSAPQAFADFVNRLVSKGKKVIVVAFGNPYLLQQIPTAPEYVVAWGPAPVSQQAAARAVLGLAPVSGQLPITIPTLAPRGTGLKFEGGHRISR